MGIERGRERTREIERARAQDILLKLFPKRQSNLMNTKGARKGS